MVVQHGGNGDDDHHVGEYSLPLDGNDFYCQAWEFLPEVNLLISLTESVMLMDFSIYSSPSFPMSSQQLDWLLVCARSTYL